MRWIFGLECKCRNKYRLQLAIYDIEADKEKRICERQD